MRDYTKLMLGTAQLGQQYGVANKVGKPNKKAAIEIIKYAMQMGINSIDTSPLYGDSEKIVGEYVKSTSTKKPFIVTKYPLINYLNSPNSKTFYQVKQVLNQSLQNLNIDAVDVYLVHVPYGVDDLDESLITSLLQLKKYGLIKKLGISVYTAKQIERLLKYTYFDVVQLPINIMDQRLLSNGTLKKLSQLNIEIHARSIFLQGIIFLNVDELPVYLQAAKEPLKKFHHLSVKYNLKKEHIALSFVRDLPWVNNLIIGCETIEQLKKNLEIYQLPKIAPEVLKEVQEIFNDIPEYIINPVFWK